MDYTAKPNLSMSSAVVALFFLPTAIALAETPPARVEAPEVKIGDTWTFDHIDGWKKERDYTSVTTVVSLEDNGSRTETITRTDNGIVATNTRTKDLNQMIRDTPSGKFIATPYIPTFSFPLEAGKTWEQEVANTRSRDLSRKVIWQAQGKVIGWEKVTVPAGTFDALKVVIKGYYRGSDAHNSWSGERTDTVWYVPEARRYVKWIYMDVPRGKVMDHEIYELAAYKLAQ